MFAVGKRRRSKMSEACSQGRTRDMELVPTTRHPSRSKKLKDFLN